MNKRHLIWSIGVGVGFGFLMLGVISPRKESFTINLSSEERYHEVIEDDERRLEVSRYGDGSLDVSFKRRRDSGHYILGALLAFIFGSSQYENMKKEATRKAAAERKEESFAISSTRPPNEDPLYEEFLQEDENRQMFPRPHLEKDFEAWKLERNSEGETKV